jgi:hypothetical protein
MRTSLVAIIVTTCVAGCASAPQPPGYGSRGNVRLQQPPERAAACFARNAEEHSSALVAEVRPGRDSAEVIVRVKNGILYGTGQFERAGSGSSATIALNVTTSGRRNDLIRELTEGC